MFATAKTDRIETNVLFLSNLENRIGMNRPVIAIVKVNELTYNPETAIDVLKYSEICEMIPMMLKGVLIPSVDSIRIYKSIFGLSFMFSIPFI
jgi:hypothetical protein